MPKLKETNEEKMSRWFTFVIEIYNACSGGEKMNCSAIARSNRVSHDAVAGMVRLGYVDRVSTSKPYSPAIYRWAWGARPTWEDAEKICQDCAAFKAEAYRISKESQKKEQDQEKPSESKPEPGQPRLHLVSPPSESDAEILKRIENKLDRLLEIWDLPAIQN